MSDEWEFTAEEQAIIDQMPPNLDEGGDEPRMELVSPGTAGQWTDRPVRFALLYGSDENILGALWVGERDETAGFIASPSAGDDGVQAQMEWRLRIAQAQAHPSWSAGTFWDYWLDARLAASVLIPQEFTLPSTDALMSYIR